MADNQGKHSSSRAQGSQPSAQASTQPAGKTKEPKQSEDQPSAMARRGQIVANHRAKRRFYRFHEIHGRVADFIEVHTVGDYHAIDVRFQDKTALHFVIEPGFSVYTESADWQGGKGRSIKRWPIIRSLGLKT